MLRFLYIPPTRLGSAGINQRRNVFHAPKPVGYTSRHRRRKPAPHDRLTLLAEWQGGDGERGAIFTSGDHCAVAGFHARVSRCASAIWSGVISLATPAPSPAAFLSPWAAARLSHMYA